MKTSQTKEQRENKKAERNIYNMQNNYKIFNIGLMAIWKRQKERNNNKKLFKVIMTNNFPKSMRHKPQMREAQRTLSKIRIKNSIPRHTIFKTSSQRQIKNNQKGQEWQERQLTYR